MQIRLLLFIWLRLALPALVSFQRAMSRVVVNGVHRVLALRRYQRRFVRHAFFRGAIHRDTSKVFADF